VLTHELVHCYQWDAEGTCPGGLIEGVADWVRLNCHLSPPHWKRETGGGMFLPYLGAAFSHKPSTEPRERSSLTPPLSDWDRGYQHTAYFLQYLEVRFGEGTIRRLNDKLRRHKYKAESFWPELLGESVDKLYGDYVEKSKDEDDGDDLCTFQQHGSTELGSLNVTSR
jgi:hypothetical protein